MTAHRLACILSLCTTACSQTTTITLADGREIDGRIVQGTAETIRVKPTPRRVLVTSDAPALDVVTIRRDQIADVDHPGNVAAGAGVLLLTVGLVAAAIIHCDCEHAEDPGFAGYAIPGVFILGGAGMITYGGAQYVRSADAYAPPPGGRADTNVATRQIGWRWHF